jgi:hypothetical protein
MLCFAYCEQCSGSPTVKDHSESQEKKKEEIGQVTEV